MAPRRQGADRLFPFAAQPLENRPPGRVAEGPEEQVVRVRHVGPITRWLLIDT